MHTWFWTHIFICQDTDVPDSKGRGEGKGENGRECRESERETMGG